MGELSAMEWFASKGAMVCFPIGHSPDWDFIAEQEGRLVRVQVKTCIAFRNARWEVAICTRGGNQSWNRIVKRLERDRCDYLFVVVGDGRRWSIPSEAIEAKTHMLLGGPKYAQFEVEPGRPLPPRTADETPSTIAS